MNPSVDPNSLQDVYLELYRLIGEENMHKVFELVKGEQISFPMHLYARDKVRKAIVDNQGDDLLELQNKYGYSRRWIRTVIRDAGSKNSSATLIRLSSKQRTM